MSLEKRHEIARKGGKSVPAEKRSYSQNPELTATSGQKAGKASPLKTALFHGIVSLQPQPARKVARGGLWREFGR